MLVHRARDIHKCLKSIASFTNHQAKVKDWDSEHLEWICIQIIPKEGPYCGGIYEFKIIFGSHYPKQPPQVDCITPIYHPNIDMTGEDYNVCLSLFDEWQSNFGLEDVIQGILFLMYHPNLEDPLSPWFDPSMSKQEFEENLQRTLRGQLIEDAINYEFPKMIEGETISTEDDNTSKETDYKECSKEESELDSNTSKNVLDSGEKCTIPINETSESEKIDNENAADNKNILNSCNESEKTESILSRNLNITQYNPKEEDISEGIENATNRPIAEEIIENTDTEKDVLAIDKTVDHDEMVDIIEEKFLTGFGELMAIELSDCDNTETEDTCTTDDDDESYESFVNDTYELENSNDTFQYYRHIRPHSHRHTFLSAITRNVESIMSLLVNCYLGYEAIVPTNNGPRNGTVRARAGSTISRLSSSDDCDSDDSVQKSIELHMCDTEDSEYYGTDESYSWNSDSDTYFEDNLSESEEGDFGIPSLFEEQEIEEPVVDKNDKICTNHWVNSIQSRNLFFGLVGIYAMYKLSNIINIYIKR